MEQQMERSFFYSNDIESQDQKTIPLYIREGIISSGNITRCERGEIKPSIIKVGIYNHKGYMMKTNIYDKMDDKYKEIKYENIRNIKSEYNSNVQRFGEIQRDICTINQTNDNKHPW